MVSIFFGILICFAVLLRNQTKQVQFIPFLLLFAFAAIRYGFGNDYFSYRQMYGRYQVNGFDTFGEEHLYGILNSISPSFYIVIAITSAIFVVSVYILISNNLPKELIWVGLFIFLINPYLFLMNLSAIRQCLAMCCFMLAVWFAYKSKPLPYIGLILLASSVHQSALLLLPMYFLANDRPVKGVHVALIAFGTLCVVGLFDLSELAIRLDEEFGGSGYGHYLEDSSGNSLRATLLTGTYFVYLLGNFSRLKGFGLVSGKLYLVGLILGVFAYDASMFTRYQMYFDIFSVVALPLIVSSVWNAGPVVVDERNILKTIWGLVNRYAMPVLILSIYLLRCYSFFTNSLWSSFTEYSTIFGVL